MEREYHLKLTESELQALEVIVSCVDYNKLVNVNSMALSMHHIKLSDLFLTLEKVKEFIQDNLKRDDE